MDISMTGMGIKEIAFLRFGLLIIADLHQYTSSAAACPWHFLLDSFRTSLSPDRISKSPRTPIKSVAIDQACWLLLCYLPLYLDYPGAKSAASQVARRSWNFTN